MFKIFITGCLLVIGAYSSAIAGELYLVQIESHQQLEALNEIAGRAHGRLGDKFILDMDRGQADKLEYTGIKAELIAPDFDPDSFYLIKKIHPRIPELPKTYSPAASYQGTDIARLTEEQVEDLRDNHYRVTKLVDHNTPLFISEPSSTISPIRNIDDFPSDSLALLTNQDSLYSYVLTLQNFQTRFTASDSIDSARDWLIAKFQSFGYSDIFTQGFNVTSAYQGVINEPAFNVICRKTGTENPDKIVIIGAHYDSYNAGPSDPMVFAPGADDNASGTSAVLEIARLFSNIETKYTYLFVAFSGEEQYLVGSEYMATQLENDGADVELMVNFDMIGYTIQTPSVTDVFWDHSDKYARILMATYDRLTDLNVHFGKGSISDGESFAERDWNTISLFEWDFNQYAYHSDYDIVDTINFEYLYKNVLGCMAGLAYANAAPSKVPFELLDTGDGSSLKFTWQPLQDDVSYRIVYGTSNTNLNDTVDLPVMSSEYTLGGLTENQVYYAAVMAVSPEGYPSYDYDILYQIPMSIPRTPQNLMAEPDSMAVYLDWEPNPELDIDHYRILRKLGDDPWITIDDNCIEDVFTDHTTDAHEQYYYRVLAIDNDFNESDSSNLVRCTPAAFDLGILLIDEFLPGDINPGENAQSQFFQTVFGFIRVAFPHAGQHFGNQAG